MGEGWRKRGSEGWGEGEGGWGRGGGREREGERERVKRGVDKIGV